MFTNTHIHVQRNLDTANIVPLRTIIDTKGFGWVLHIVQPFSDNDALDRYRILLKYSHLTSEEIFNLVKNEYPEGTVFWILAIDMTNIGVGGIKRTYEEQLEELINLKKKYPRIIKAFIHLDPRNSNIINKYNTDVIFRNEFDGIKLYTPMGYAPYHARLDFAFSDAERRGKPIITHCTMDSTIHYLGSKKALKQLVIQNVYPEFINPEWKSKKELCNNFMQPLGYEYVLTRHPKLKISFAHFGRGNQWDKDILYLMHKYNGQVYCDGSYTMYDKSRWASNLLRMQDDEVFCKHFVAGSDFYMNVVEGGKSVEKQFSQELRVYMGEKYWNYYAIENPNRLMNEL
jgi:predicted TIM-barrel fold metal-dependent hydrolase